MKLRLDEMGDAELADVKGNISAMVQIGSVGGAALSVYLDIGNLRLSYPCSKEDRAKS